MALPLILQNRNSRDAKEEKGDQQRAGQCVPPSRKGPGEGGDSPPEEGLAEVVGVPGETPKAALKKLSVVPRLPLEAVELSVRHDLEEKTHGPDRESEEVGEEEARPGEVVDHEDRKDDHQEENPLK